MTDKRFEVHGEVTAQYNPLMNILFVDVTGPFNMEFMHYYERKVGAVRQNVPTEKWVSVVNVKGLGLGPMDALTEAQKVVNNAMRVGLVATAIVFHDSEALDMQKTFWSRAYKNSGIDYGFFEQTTQAVEWVTDSLAKVEHRDNESFKKMIK